MTYQEKMKWLGRYQAALSYQHMLEDEIEVLRSDAERVTTCMSGMPGRGGPNVNRLPRAVERIEKAQKKLAQQLDSCLETRMEVMHSIMALGDTAEQEVLRPPLCDGPELHRHCQCDGRSAAPGLPAAPRRVWRRWSCGAENISVNFAKVSRNFIAFHN